MPTQATRSSGPATISTGPCRRGARGRLRHSAATSTDLASSSTRSSARHWRGPARPRRSWPPGLNGRVRLDDRLGGPLSLAIVEEILRDAGDPVRPILVGHDPDFSELLAVLTGAWSLPMRKGSLARLDLRRPLQPGTGILRFLLPPGLLGS